MGQRPPHLKPPAHWKSDAPPKPAPATASSDEHGGPKGEEPTRYGDWENKGIAWDF